MRIVIKVGTNLVTAKDGSLDRGRIANFADDLAAARKAGCQVVLVSSGAIGAGMGKLGLDRRPGTLKEKQALAAIGQPLLMNAYGEKFNKRGLTIAQVLLTRQDFADRTRYLNARNTLLALLELGVIPIINENDTVAVDEIKSGGNFGDNDTLAALVAGNVTADLLMLLTDVDGLYAGVPGKSPLVPVVEKITPDIEKMASPLSGSGKGTGGMQTKLGAARIATAAGVKMVIAGGAIPGIVMKLVKGEAIGTTFLPRKSLEARKCWIAFGTKCRGKIIVDSGAANALINKGKSLLPSGIVASEGCFEVGDTVSIFTPENKEIARGLVQYSAGAVEKINGKKTADLRKLLDRADFDEVIHRDNLVIL
jgi:glutamate 5-kinase